MYFLRILTLSGAADTYTFDTYHGALETLEDRMNNGVGVIKGTIITAAGNVMARAYAPGYCPDDDRINC